MEGLDPQLIDALYGPAVHEGNWRPALERMRILFNSAETALSYFDRWPVCIQQETSGHVYTKEARDRYSRDVGRLDPKRPLMSRSNDVFNDARHFDDRFIAHSPFYQEITIPLGLRHTLLLTLKGSNQEVVLATNRTAKLGPYDVRAENLLRTLGRHFARAIALKNRVDEVRTLAHSATAVLDRLCDGILILDHAGRVVVANEPARSLLTSGGELLLRQSRLVARSAGNDGALAAALHTVLSGAGAAPILRVVCAKRGHIVVHCIPLPASSPLAPAERPAALVVLREASPARTLSAAEIEAIYGLTPSEAQLALALDAGESLAQFAKTRSVKLSTVRTQLHATLQKMGLHRQVDLVRTLAALKSPIRGDRD